MRIKLLPGAAGKLRALGVHPNRLGVIVNKLVELPDNITVPESQDELADALADDARLRPIMANRQVLGSYMQAYAEKWARRNPGTQQDLQVEIQRGIANFLKEKDVDEANRDRIERLNLTPGTRSANMLTSHRQGAAYNPHASGAVMDKMFNSASEFFAAAWSANPDPKIHAKMQQIRNDYSSIIPADGGHLVPETLRSQLLQMALEMSVVRPRATVVPMESARVPFPMIDVTSHATSVFGGMIAYWGEESAALTQSNPRFGKVVLEAHKLTGFAMVPNELLTDSIISFSALIESLWPRCLAFFEDIAFMSGSGTGEPLGFLGSNNPAAIAVDAEAGQAADTVELFNIVKMYARMLPTSLNSAIWICSPRVLPQLFTMALNVGTGGGPVMLTNAAGPAPMTILGRPLVVSEKASALGNRGDISFVDLSYYLVGDRQQMTAATSTDFRFQNDQTSYRIIQRVDGKPWIQSALTPQNGDETLSPFVELAAR